MDDRNKKDGSTWNQLVLSFLTDQISVEKLESLLVGECGEVDDPKIYEFLLFLAEARRGHRNILELKEIFKGIIDDLH